MVKATKSNQLGLTYSEQRRAVKNGHYLLRHVDHRSVHARRYKQLVEQYKRQFGGQDIELINQLASLVTHREILDAQVLNGQHVDTLHLVRVSGAINRTMDRLRGHKKKKPKSNTVMVRERRRRNRELREAGLLQ